MLSNENVNYRYYNGCVEKSGICIVQHIRQAGGVNVAPVLRGGYYDGMSAGVVALYLAHAPSHSSKNGFRCARPWYSSWWWVDGDDCLRADRHTLVLPCVSALA